MNFISLTLGVDFPPMAIKKHQFGSCVITSLSGMGIKNCTAPFNAASKVPILVTVNQIYPAAVVVDG